jgi:hypothetical protein
LFRKFNALLGGFGFEKGLGETGKEAGTITAGSVGVDTAAMGQAFKSGQRIINDVVTGRSAESCDKASATGIMVRMAPVGAHTGGSLPLAAVGRQVHICL